MIEQVLNSSMHGQKSLSLPLGLEPSHSALPYPGRFMRLLGPIILILLSTVDRLGYQFTMGYAITPQLVCHDLPGFALVTPDQSLEEALCGRSELYAPEADRFATDSDASFSQEVFDITVVQVEAIVEPDCKADDIWRESVALISIHEPILPISGI